MARVLIVGGGERGRAFAGALLEAGHAVRVVLEPDAADAPLPGGAEAFRGDASRVGTLKPALAQVTVACWLFGCPPEGAGEVTALHSSRLERFLEQTLDSSVRGLVYEAAGSVEEQTLAGGRSIVERFATFNAIPFAFLTADPSERGPWLEHALEAVAQILGRYSSD